MLLLGVDKKRSSEGGGFDPSPYGTVVGYWHSHYSSKWKNAARSDAATADNDLVRVWDDLSGNGYHWTTPSDAARFTLKLNVQNGMPSLRSDGSAAYFSLGDLAALDFGTGNFSIFIVFKQTAGSRAILLKDTYASGADNGLYFYHSSGAVVGWWNGAGNSFGFVADSNFNQFQIIRSGTGANQMAGYKNGGAAVLGQEARTLSNTKNATLFGDTGGTNLGVGDLCALLIYSEDVSADRAEIRDALNADFLTF